MFTFKILSLRITIYLFRMEFGAQVIVKKAAKFEEKRDVGLYNGEKFYGFLVLFASHVVVAYRFVLPIVDC